MFLVAPRVVSRMERGVVVACVGVGCGIMLLMTANPLWLIGLFVAAVIAGWEIGTQLFPEAV